MNETIDQLTLNTKVELSPLAVINIKRTKKVFSDIDNIKKFHAVILEEYSNNVKMARALEQLSSISRFGLYNPEKFIKQATKFVYQLYVHYEGQASISFDNGVSITTRKINPSIVYIGEMILKFVKANDTGK